MRSLLTPALLALLLTSCTSISPGIKETNANRLAFPVFMIPRVVHAGPFDLKAFERVHEKGSVANLYIEGSAIPVRYRSPWDVTPTPTNLVGLEMAARDSAKNVIWLARPCQFRMGYEDGKEDCPLTYQGEKMFAPEVLDAYNAALDEMKARYHVTGFNLVGYDSGGGLAAILAAQRNDVLSLRTVAGLLDTLTYTRAHDMPPMDDSFNPIDFVGQLASKPQRHYIAQLDDVVPNAVYHSYAQAINDERCLSYTFVQDVDHNFAWAENWPAFLREDKMSCLGATPPDAGEREARKRVFEPQIGPK